MTQRHRSVFASRNRRGRVRCSTCSWCRNARISSWSAARECAHVRRVRRSGQEHRHHRPEAYPSSAATSTAATRTDFSVGTALLDLSERFPLGSRSQIGCDHLAEVWLAWLFGSRLACRRLVSEPHEQRPYFDQARGSTGRDGHPAEIGQEESSVAGPVLPADIDRDVVALEPRARGVSDFAVLARGMTDDLQEERVVDR